MIEGSEASSGLTDEHHSWMEDFFGFSTRPKSDSAPAAGAALDGMAPAPKTESTGGVAAQSGTSGTIDPSSVSLPMLSKGSPPPDDLTDDHAWQTGYDAGFASPDTSVAPQITYAPRSAEAFYAGVKAGQEAAKKTRSSVPAGTDSANRPTFSNSVFQKLYDDAIAAVQNVSPNQVAALRSLASGKSGPWKNLSWSTIANSSASRILKPSLIDQKTLNVCGSAAALVDRI